jgi:3-oxoacyl-[acyl-carrier-protein] synthase-3
MAFEIVATGASIPPDRVSNDEFSGRTGVETNDEWIRSHTGIGARHWAAKDVSCSDMAAWAARDAIAMFGERYGGTEKEIAESLDVLIIATTTPDYVGVPGTACFVQERLGAKNAAPFDITVCCTGFIYGLEIAAGLLSLNAGRRRALVIGSELLSRITDFDDRASCVLFGDGAAAAIIEKTDAPAAGAGRRGLIRSHLAGDGSGAEALIVRRGGLRFPFKAGETVEKAPCLEMDGHAVYNFAVKAITETIARLLAEENLSVNDIDLIIPHQANARIVQAAKKRLGIPDEKVFLNIEEYGNTSSASIPIGLNFLNREGRLRRGQLIMLVGFGAGMTYGGNLIVW